jgi:hypothetical protein
MPADISFPNLDGYRVDGTTGADTCESFTHGNVDSRNIWDKGWNACFRALNWLLGASANGQLLIGNNSTGRFVKAVPTGSNGIVRTAGAGTLDFANSWTGDIGIASGTTTINSGVVTPSKMSDEARNQNLTAIAELDLNGPSARVPIRLIKAASTIIAIDYVYTVASGAGTGVTVQVGKQGNPDFFATSTSLASQAQDTVSNQTILNSGVVDAGDFLVCSTTGSVATTGGKILVCILLRTN